MTKTFRAAMIAAVTAGAAFVASGSAPGYAVEADQAPVTGYNLPDLQKVPTPPTLVEPSPLPAQIEAAENEALAEVEEIAPAVAFASLADAVDAQILPDAVDDELRCLATGIYFESKGEPLQGQLAVAEVILNRAESRRFPQNVCSVLTQHRQFSFVRGGRLPTPPKDRSWRTALAVAQVARDASWESSVSDALFFHANYVSPRWRLARVGAVGNHIFYR